VVGWGSGARSNPNVLVADLRPTPQEGASLWIRVDPRFDLIRDDPRYHDLLRRMKIPE
jgi:hypothetical protein